MRIKASLILNMICVTIHLHEAYQEPSLFHACFHQTPEVHVDGAMQGGEVRQLQPKSATAFSTKSHAQSSSVTAHDLASMPVTESVSS